MPLALTGSFAPADEAARQSIVNSIGALSQPDLTQLLRDVNNPNLSKSEQIKWQGMLMQPTATWQTIQYVALAVIRPGSSPFPQYIVTPIEKI